MLRAKAKIPEGTEDPIVAKTSQNLGAILLTDDSDFRKIVARRPNGERRRFRKLSRVHLACKHSQAVNRLTTSISLIEFEYEIAQKMADRRMIIEVQTTQIKTIR